MRLAKRQRAKAQGGKAAACRLHSILHCAFGIRPLAHRESNMLIPCRQEVQFLQGRQTRDQDKRTKCLERDSTPMAEWTEALPF